MWARIAELMLGVWLVLSPLVFRGTLAAEQFAARDVVFGALVILCALLSYWRRTVRAHLVTGAAALAVGLAAYLSWPRPGPPAAQHDITVALILLILAVVPNEASRPPRPWREVG